MPILHIIGSLARFYSAAEGHSHSIKTLPQMFAMVYVIYLPVYASFLNRALPFSNGNSDISFVAGARGDKTRQFYNNSLRFNHENIECRSQSGRKGR